MKIFTFFCDGGGWGGLVVGTQNNQPSKTALLKSQHTVQYFYNTPSLYNTPHYNTDLDITQSCCGSQISLTMEFYKGIIGK